MVKTFFVTSIVLYIPRAGDYLKVLTDVEVKHFVVINFEYFKPVRKKLYSKLSVEQNLRKCFESLYIFSTTLDKVKTYVEMM